METYYIGEEHLDEDDDDTVLSDPVDHTPEPEGSTYQYAAISTTVTLRPTANIYLLNVSDRTGSQIVSDSCMDPQCWRIPESREQNQHNHRYRRESSTKIELSRHTGHQLTILENNKRIQAN